MAEGEGATKEVTGGLSHKLGPLPVWAWLVIGVGGAAAAYYLLVGKNSASNNPYLNLPGTLGGPFTGGGGGGGDGTVSGPTSTAPLTATAQQIQTALNTVATSLQVPFSEVSTYWNEYMAGTAPVGNTNATGEYNTVIQQILNTLGASAPTPTSTGNVNANPYTSNTTWFNSILSALPSGTSASVISELTQLVNGTTTTISQDAANALIAAENVVGVGPNPLSYTITPPATTAPPAQPPSGGPPVLPPSPVSLTPNVTSNQITNWQSIFGAGTNSFGQWFTDATNVFGSSIINVLSSSQWQQIYNYWNGGGGAGMSASQLAAQLNGWLQNPSTIPTAPPTTKSPPTSNTNPAGVGVAPSQSGVH